MGDQSRIAAIGQQCFPFGQGQSGGTADQQGSQPVAGSVPDPGLRIMPPDMQQGRRLPQVSNHATPLVGILTSQSRPVPGRLGTKPGTAREQTTQQGQHGQQSAAVAASGLQFQAQRIQLDEAGRILLVVGAGIVLEGGDALVK